MISNSNVKYICKHRELVENYDEAMLDDTQMWDLHHRLETHFSDGSERPSNAFLSKEELISLNMYWHRPPEELIFLRKSDHYKLHGKNEQSRRNISLGKGGTGILKSKIAIIKLSNYWDSYIEYYTSIYYKHSEHERRVKTTKGRVLSEETKLKMSQAAKGRVRIQSEEEKQRRREKIRKLRTLYESYKEKGINISWNEFQKSYKNTQNIKALLK